MEKDVVSLEDALEHGLTKEEFQKIQEILGRIPNSTELGIFSAMWSEHCSYKNSILKLKLFRQPQINYLQKQEKKTLEQWI